MGQYEYEAARSIFQKLADAQPGWHDVQVNLAIATLNRQREGDEAAALEILQRVLKADDQHVRATYCAGLLRLYLQSPEEALRDFQFVAERDPKDAYAAYYVGQCLAQSRKYEEALTWYQRVMELDPYLRSAYYAASQAYRATGRNDEAAQMLELFQRLARNPRARLASFQYGNMGPKSEVVAIDLASPPPPLAPPQGPIFADPDALLTNGEQFEWNAARLDRPVSITACDIDGDGHIDIFIANVLNGERLRNAVCINNGDAGGAATFTLDPDHILATIPDVNAALWGDIDNDGLTDVYLCRRGPNMLWRQKEKNAWTDVSDSTDTANGELNTVSGLIFDADHDGDLDIFCVNADGPNELLNNNRDQPLTFKPIAQEQGIAGEGNASRQALAVDLDRDRDLDIIVINAQPPHEVYINDRLWQYRAAEAYDALRQAREVHAILAADVNAIGELTLFRINEFGAIVRWAATESSDPQRVSPAMGHTGPVPSFKQCELLDPVGDGILRLLHPPGADRFLALTDLAGARIAQLDAGHWISGWLSVNLNNLQGPSVIAVRDVAAPLIWRPGSGRHQFASVIFTGKEDIGAGPPPMRSNASGIGAHYAARIGSRWIAGSTLPNHSGPGQSLQPHVIGLGGAAKIDFIAIDWPDGVFQTELDLEAGKHHIIAEKQRVQSSCPVLFAWDGEKFEFVTDLLGVGGIGYMLTPVPPTYAPSRPWENVMLPLNLLQPKAGKFQIKLGEPMEEACYLDAARLIAYDLPPGWRMTLDERMGINDPQPTGAAVFYRDELMPIKAINDRGEDVTESIIAADLRAAPIPPHDERFIGMLKHDHVLTMTFDRDVIVPAQQTSRSTTPGSENRATVLIIDGWIEYPYSQTMFAAWQSQGEYRSPTLEAQDEHGNWHMVLEQFGYPAGMPRQMAMPLPIEKLPEGVKALRITTNQEIYFDRIAIAYVEHKPDEARRHALKMDRAALGRVGFAKRSDGPQRQPYYDYNNRAPHWDTRHQSGWYTAFGPVDELVGEVDDALTIFGPGEEVHLDFDDDLPALAEGWARIFVLETNGWCKDMDLFTQEGETLDPLPDTGKDTSKRDALHRKYNTRFEVGR